MLIESLKSLGARSLKDGSQDKLSISQVESELNVKFSDSYRSVLESYENSIVFDHGAIYKPVEKSPVDNTDGFQSLEMLYGLQGDSNLVSRNKMYKGQIPKECVVIGESVGGNQVCLSRASGKVYFWFHEAEIEDHSLFEVAESVNNFIEGLLPDDMQNSDKREIDESGSFLDF
ncbi:SMI1/KNR4 family protein [Microbulbifer sp. ALW1]|uniref:SMI1/KNR4 family protein n=1 Tax=Microbulbifer sp. (strain ALW1) TaxID=1516059 RepID=UPI001356EE8E|nr:SMI1/KNR4 family protein [Microbulbifer sp. ALW1]